MRELLRRSTATLVRYGRAIDRRVSGRALLRLYRNRTPDGLAGRRILFLCEGNVCRSPLAAELARRLLTTAARVDSAGLGAAVGRTPPPLALEVAANLGVGLELRAHRSATVTREQVREADCVFVMDGLNVLRAWRRFPEARGKLFLLDAPREVPDPYGEAEPVFRSSFEQIRTAVERLAHRPALRPALHPWPGATVVVADAERNTSLCVARSLARAGHRVLAVAREDAPGGGALRSSSVARVERAPADSRAYAEAVVSLARREGAVAIFAHYERTLLELHRRAGAPPPVIAGAAPAQLELCAHKSRVLEAARRAGVPVPDTRIVDAGTSGPDLAREVRSLAAAHGWPLYAKVDSELGVPPGRDHRYLVLEGDQDLPRLAEFVRARGTVLLQERVEGQGCGIAGVFVRGAPACVGGHVRLREAQASGGVSTFCESRVVPEALRSATVLLTALGWTGVAMVEFKLPPGGPPVLMEVNPRLWGTLPLYVRAGADVPLAALQLALDGRVPPGRPYEEGCRLRFLLPDLVAIREQRRGLRRLAALARAVAETPWIVPEATFSFRDPLPFLVEVVDQTSESLRRRLGRPG